MFFIRWYLTGAAIFEKKYSRAFGKSKTILSIMSQNPIQMNKFNNIVEPPILHLGYSDKPHLILIY